MHIQVILEPNVTPDQLTELGLLAEKHGIQGVWLQNHAIAADPFMSLVPLARASSRIQIGVVIVSPCEMHPAKIAISLLTLNEFSRGRAALVLGRGGEWMGITGTDFGKPLRPVKDALGIITRAARGEGIKGVINYDGEIYKARYLRTPWVKQQAHPLVYAGVTKDRMLRLATESADGVMLADLALPAVAGERVRLAVSALAEIGRPRSEFRINDFVGWHVKEDQEVALREARRELVIRAWLERDWLTPFLSEAEADLVVRKKPAFIKAFRERTGNIEGVPGDIVAKLIEGLTITTTVGQFDKALDRLQQFQAAGLDEIALRVHDDPAQAIQLIGERVVPQFR